MQGRVEATQPEWARGLAALAQQPRPWVAQPRPAAGPSAQEVAQVARLIQERQALAESLAEAARTREAEGSEQAARIAELTEQCGQLKTRLATSLATAAGDLRRAMSTAAAVKAERDALAAAQARSAEAAAAAEARLHQLSAEATALQARLAVWEAEPKPREPLALACAPGQPAAEWLAEGWHAVEAEGAWSRSTTARLVLPKSSGWQHCRHLTLAGDLLMPAHGHGITGNSVALALNGVASTALSFRSRGGAYVLPLEARCVLERQVAARGEALEVTVNTGQLYCPAIWDLAPDARWIGFRLRSVTLS